MQNASVINVLAELERAGVEWVPVSPDEVKVVCPFHKDKDPSCCVNTAGKGFNCPVAGCGASGDIISLLCGVLKVNRQTMVADLATRYHLGKDKTVAIDVIERWHAHIWQSFPLLKELRQRGVTDDLIRKWRLGAHDGRVTIPIWNSLRECVNVRRYMPGAPAAQKMLNLKGFGGIRLYPENQMEYETILLTGGECKAIVAADQLNPHGIGAICATAGEDNLTPAILQRFKDKRVIVCMDIDDAGQAAAERHCKDLSPIASEVRNLVLPLDKQKHPKGDINDYVGAENGNMFEAIKLSEVYVSVVQSRNAEDDSPPVELQLHQAYHADNAGRRVSVKATVCSMDLAPYVVPNELTVLCRKDQEYCAICPVKLERRDSFTIRPESASVLEFVGTNSSGHLDVVKKSVGIPRQCRVCDVNVDSYYNVEDVKLSGTLDIQNRDSDSRNLPALCIGKGLELNEGYECTGRMWPHPKTQQAVLLISEYKPTQDALSQFALEEAEAQELSLFWPEEEWSVERIDEKLKDIYSDFEANVTRIYDRPDLHLLTDLFFHSPLFLPFDGKTVKGWVEVLVVGDSSCGKSETTGGIRSHYRLGDTFVCKNATVAGMLGGLQKSGDRWFVTWGAIPSNDKGWLIMEELKGASVEAIAALTDMRTRGVAEMPKIERKRTNARTRLLCVSNPRFSLNLNRYNYGIQAALELIGNPEDLRRFDAVLTVDKNEVDVDAINALASSRAPVEHKYNSELCRRLVLWAATRKTEEVEFTPEATSACIEEASRLTGMFDESIPIVDRGSMRYKIARLSAALAARTFSCSEDYQRLIIHEGHVRYIAKMLVRLYNSKAFGYGEYSQAMRVQSTLIDPDKVQKALEATPHVKDLIDHLLAKNVMDAQDIADWCDWERDQAAELISLLVRKHALERITSRSATYRKTAPFIELLRRLKETGKFKEPPPELEDDGRKF